MKDKSEMQNKYRDHETCIMNFQHPLKYSLHVQVDIQVGLILLGIPRIAK